MLHPHGSPHNVGKDLREPLPGKMAGAVAPPTARHLEETGERAERAGQARVTPLCSLGRRAGDARKSAGAGVSPTGPGLCLEQYPGFADCAGQGST